MNQGYKELTINLLEKAPEAGPLLVKLHDKHRLYELAGNKEPEASVELADIMADLLNIGVSQNENELITDVLMSLIRQAESDLRQAVAERMAMLETAPVRLILHLATDEIAIADPVLRKSRVLEDVDLIYLIKGQTKAYWQSIAKRTKMSPALVNALADTKDQGTAIVLTENNNISLTDHAVQIFADMAKTSEDLAKPLLHRKEVSYDLAMRLYEFVGHELKDYINANFTEGNKKTEDKYNSIIDEIVFEFVDGYGDELSPTQQMISVAEKMYSNGMLDTKVMIDNLRRGQFANFSAQFSVFCGLPISTVIEILQQTSAQGLAVACKGIGILKPEFVNMFLLTSRVRGVRMVEQKDLNRALAYYDKVKEDVAQDILRQSRH
jgi:uncharacterized protein (DUF2336 family)